MAKVASVATARSDLPGTPLEQARLGGGISRGLVGLLAVACGLAVANLYYAQPLLHTLSRAFSVSTGTAGLLVTISQVGYVIGLAFVVPLGDLLERRALIVAAMLVTALAMATCAVAPGFAVFAAATAVVGLTCVTAQVIVPMSSSLAEPAQRGRVVGTVMSGLLIGILLARTFSGIIASAVGWRVVFWLGAGFMVALAATLWRTLPRVPPTTDLRYGEVLRSVGSLIASQPVLRQRMALGAMTFGCFSTLWTALSFLLSGQGGGHYHYGNAVIGLFGLAGVAGAGAATIVGRMADRGRGARATSVTAVVMLVSWAILFVGRDSVIALIVGIAVLDLGAQGLHISNQSAIYALAPEARSRLTTAYMVAYFGGGAILSALTSALYASDGWAGVCVIGAATAALAVVVWAVTARTGRAGPADRAGRRRGDAAASKDA